MCFCLICASIYDIIIILYSRPNILVNNVSLLVLDWLMLYMDHHDHQHILLMLFENACPLPKESILFKFPTETNIATGHFFMVKKNKLAPSRTKKKKKHNPPRTWKKKTCPARLEKKQNLPFQAWKKKKLVLTQTSCPPPWSLMVRPLVKPLLP